jgi:hypothetical protein
MGKVGSGSSSQLDMLENVVGESIHSTVYATAMILGKAAPEMRRVCD